MKQVTALTLVRNPDAQPVEQTADGTVIVNRITHVAAPDVLMSVAKAAAEGGLEPGALLRAATRAGLVVRIGRQTCARRSDLLRLVELAPKAKAEPSSDDPKAAYAALVGRGTR